MTEIRAKSSYRCPVCGEDDEYAYLRCYRPNCTDGRDRFGRTIPIDAPAYYREREGPVPVSSGLRSLLAGLFLGFVIGLFWGWVLL